LHDFKKETINIKNTGMKKLSISALFLCTILSISAQEVVWQKDIKSGTQDFLSQITTTIDGQYLITGSSIQAGSKKMEAGSNARQNNGYDYHLIKLNQQGEEVWEKYFSGQNHDFLSATVNTRRRIFTFRNFIFGKIFR
jgi:hypothetical protein